MSSEIFSNLNWLAILVGGLGYFFLGAIWYSVLFKHAWIRATGVNMNDPNGKKGVGAIMAGSLVLMIITSLGVGILIARIDPHGGWISGAKIGLLAGLCFSATAISISYVYEKRPLALHLINGAYNVLGAVIAGIIIAVWPK